MAQFVVGGGDGGNIFLFHFRLHKHEFGALLATVCCGAHSARHTEGNEEAGGGISVLGNSPSDNSDEGNKIVADGRTNPSPRTHLFYIEFMVIVILYGKKQKPLYEAQNSQMEINRTNDAKHLLLAPMVTFQLVRRCRDLLFFVHRNFFVHHLHE